MDKIEIIKAVCLGIKEANSTYEKWTNGEMWLNDSGVENLLSVKIAEKIVNQKTGLHLKQGEFLRLETSFKEIKNNSGAHSRVGRPKKILEGIQQRIDITLWDRNKKIIGIIEVKRKWDKGTCTDDLDRLKALVQDYGKNNGGSIKFGILGVFIAQKNLATVKKKCETIEDYCKNYDRTGLKPIRSINLPIRTYVDDKWTSGGAIVTIEPK